MIASYEQALLNRLKKSDQAAFTMIFSAYYGDLVRFAFGFFRNSDEAEEVVQDVFVTLWENREQLNIHTSLKAHLLKSVQNRSIDRLRHKAVRDRFASRPAAQNLLVNDTENYVFFSDLESKFLEAMASIPPKLSEAFRMSRLESLPYSEIAEKLGVSVRTVETRIASALKHLREELKDYFLILILLILFFRG
ncbi:MAG: RNA polymerase sigma-70 factor [Bacteroidota bacterium]